MNKLQLSWIAKWMEAHIVVSKTPKANCCNAFLHMDHKNSAEHH